MEDLGTPHLAILNCSRDPKFIEICSDCVNNDDLYFYRAHPRLAGESSPYTRRPMLYVRSLTQACNKWGVPLRTTSARHCLLLIEWKPT